MLHATKSQWPFTVALIAYQDALKRVRGCVFMYAPGCWVSRTRTTAPARYLGQGVAGQDGCAPSTAGIRAPDRSLSVILNCCLSEMKRLFVGALLIAWMQSRLSLSGRSHFMHHKLCIFCLLA